MAGYAFANPPCLLILMMMIAIPDRWAKPAQRRNRL
jgi:hypothetical protein